MAQKVNPNELTSETAAKAAGLVVFKFFTDPQKHAAALPIVSKEEGGDGIPRIVLTASTTMRDLAGDTFTKKALEKMRDAAVGTTIFLNHEKKVPYDVLGAVEKADLREEDGGIICLDYTIKVDLSTDQAQKTYSQIEKGIVKLGASVTVAVLEKQKQARGNGDVIDDVYYLECSVVGIPANPKCWVQYARKALDAALLCDSQDSSAVEAPATGAPAEKQNSLTTKTGVAAAGGEAHQSVPSPAAALVEKLRAEEVAPGTDPATIYQKGKLLEMGFAYLKSCGLFNDELAKRRPTQYELFDVFTTVVYRLWRLRQANLSAGVADDFDYRAALQEATVEYGNELLDSVLAYFGLDNPTPAEVSSYSLNLLTGLDLLITSKSAPSGAGVVLDDDAAAAEQMAQSVHDVALSLGAKCCGAGDAKTVAAEALAASPLDGADELTAKNLQLVEKVAALETERNSARGEAATWKAIADVAVDALEDFGARPLTLPGA